MAFARSPLILAAAAALALSACTDPAMMQSDPNRNTKQGAAAGALIGAGLGAIFGGDQTVKNAAVGAAVGGILGGAIGSSLDRQEAEMRAAIGNDGVTIVNTGDRLIVTLPQDITFATDSYMVRPSLRADIDAVARTLVKYPESTVQVIGHTDNTGDAGYNQQLSVSRANAVADILQAGGVSYNRLQVIGRGESEPRASNLTPEGRQMNRRVEIVVIPTAG